MSRQAEGRLVGKIITRVRERVPTAYVVKLSDRFNRGLPDVLIVINGRAIFLEVKTATGVVSRIQEVSLRSISQAGAIAQVVRSIKEVETILDTVT